MAFNINELSSSLSRYGYQKTSHYACSIILPSSMSNSGIFKETPLRVNSVNLPGFNLGTDEIKHKGFGLNEKRPIQTSFEEISMTIIADGQGMLSNTLHDWLEMIFPTNDEDSGSENVEYFEYPINYYGGLEIYVYDITSNIHTTYTFTQPFPTVLGGVQMGWENTDSILLLPVTFSYRSYKKNSSNSGFISNIDANVQNITF